MEEEGDGEDEHDLDDEDQHDDAYEEEHEDDEEEEDEEEEDEEDGEGMLFEDNESLQQLLDMGFPENRARRAIAICGGNVQRSMEWLLEHEGDPGVDEPMSEDELRSLARSRREEVNGPTNEEAVTRLREMGFSEEDVTHALRACDNNFEAAMAWLLGDREGGGMEEEEEDEEEDEEKFQEYRHFAYLLYRRILTACPTFSCSSLRL
uniref:UBA domain-containing protein n=1 Tax=Guillardia theta TaxID=55529 RepID=A0A7S4V093_GUITH